MCIKCSIKLFCAQHEEQYIFFTPDCQYRVDLTGSYFCAATTIFVGNLSFNVTEDAMYEWFGAIGEVVAIRIATFPDTGKRKGFAHVEFATHEAAVKAVEYNGEDLDGRAVRIDLSECTSLAHRCCRCFVQPHCQMPFDTMRYCVARPAGRQSMGGESNGDRNDPGDGKTCFIKGFDTYMDEDSLKQALTDAFSEYGTVERVGLPYDRENQCLKGFGFVVFEEANGATV